MMAPLASLPSVPALQAAPPPLPSPAPSPRLPMCSVLPPLPVTRALSLPPPTLQNATHLQRTDGMERMDRLDRSAALARLDANWCTKLPDRAVESLVGSCLALEHLGLKGCSALVSPSIQSAKLLSLDLSLCGKLVRERERHAERERERERERESDGGIEGRRGRSWHPA